ncbi:MAG: hypothetical protein ABIR68_09710 [Ilumatobacteraceae bacterium]
MNHEHHVHEQDVPASAIIISCDTCVMRATAHCADCVVTHVLAPAPHERISFTDEEMVAMALLARAGMVPTLLHREADGTDSASG